MAKRTTRTEQINLGNELITSKKTDSRGRLIEPTAEVIPISDNIKLTLDGDVGAADFAVNAKYQEATQKEDAAYFLLEISDANNNKLIGKDLKNSEDKPARYQEFETLLDVKVGLENYAGKTLKLRAHLKCWLEESEWTPRGGGEEKVSDEKFIDITLVVPEIRPPQQDPIVSLNVVGRGLAEGEEPKNYEQHDIGKEYRIVSLVRNATGNKLIYGELELYENNNRATPDPPFKEMAGGVQPITIKRSQDWSWYKIEEDGRLTITDKKDRNFIYKLVYYLRDEYGFDFRNTIDKPLEKVKIVISIPQYKSDAVEVYNWSFDEERNAKWAELALALALAALGVATAWPGLVIASVIKGGAAGAGFGIGGAIATWFAGKTVSELAQELRAKLKKLIDDPPRFDKNYKKVIKISRKAMAFPKTTDRVKRNIHNIINSKMNICSEIDALLTTASRAWSAHHAKNSAVFKKQTVALKRFEVKLNKDIVHLANSFDSLSQYWKNLHIRISKPQLIAFKKYVAQKGLPKEAKLLLKKFGSSNKEIANIKNIVLNLSANKLDVAEYCYEYSRYLRKLAKSILEFTY